ncbi:MAG: hypothetical protein SO042_09940 [Bulleidia sp.]|nr:hypothetical protein [Bulleidia sp.]
MRTLVVFVSTVVASNVFGRPKTMMIGSKMFQDEFLKISNILSGIRNKDICPEVNLYKTLYEW